MECIKHNMIYSEVVLTSPPRKEWICSLCFQEGYEYGSHYIDNDVTFEGILKTKREKELKSQLIS